MSRPAARRVFTHTFAHRQRRWEPYRHAVSWLGGREWVTACGKRVDQYAGTLEHAPQSRLDCPACRANLAKPDLIGAWRRR